MLIQLIFLDFKMAIISMLKNLFSKVWEVLQSICFLLFGQVSWNPPKWLHQLCHRIPICSKRFGFTLLGIVILILISIYAYSWYQKRPYPDLITAHIITPKTTTIDEDQLTPDSLKIDFGTDNGGFSGKSVAPLHLINKEVTTDVTLTPTIPGKWYWETDNHLVFYPEQDWPAEQTYHIHFNKHFFADTTRIAQYDYSFTTEPFQITIPQLQFYQDPINPQTREVVATLNFNYPVDTASLEQHIKLILQAIRNDKLDLQAQSFKYFITYDKFKRTAYLHSEPLPLPKTERFLELFIDKGVRSLTGSGFTNDSLTQKVLIPDAGSYLKINAITPSIVRNNKDQPEQIFTVESTLGIKAAEFNKNIHVYLLPADYPANSLEAAKEHYHWQNPGEVTPAILALATPLPMDALPTDREYATLHSYRFNVEEPRFIYITIDKGLKGFGDYVLTNDYRAIIQVPEYPKEIGFLHKGALLSLSGEKKLSIAVRGIPAVKFTIARVLENNINQLITQTDGTFNDPRFLNYSFNENNISDIFSEMRLFDATHLSKQQYTALDLGKYLNTKMNPGGPLGLFLLKGQAWDTDNDTPLDTQVNRLILITDLGLIVKDNKDHSHDVFVQSISAGVPVANVTVSILGKNGLVIMSRVTDKMGHVNFPSLSDFTDEQEPTVYLARSGNDVSFIPFNKPDRQLNYSRFDIGGVTSNDEEKNLSAFIFTERGIYRPGDTAHIAMIVKQTYANPAPVGLPLEITITDPRGVTVQDQKITLDAAGYFSLDLPTTSSSPTGEYTVNAFIVKDNHPSSLIGSTTLRIAEFLPDRMRIHAQLSTENNHGWVKPTELSANITLMNLYGAPAANRKISGRILLTPKTVKFTEFPDYIFVDPLFDANKPPKVFTDNLTDTETDSEGKAHFNLNLDRFEKSTYQLTFFTEGFEAEGGRSVSTQITALVSPLNYLIGYKSDGDLHFIQQNAQRNIHFIAVNPELKSQTLTKLKLQLYEQHTVSTLVKKPDGTFQYESLIQPTLVSSVPFTIDASGTDYILPATTIGDFAVTLADENGIELSHLNYTIVGNSQQPLPKNAELSVKLKNTTFSPDQDIEMEITAPYTGTGLITIERDKVYTYQWFKTDTTSSIQKIHIPNDFQGDGYVNIEFVRDWNSPDIFMSPLSYTVVPFSVTHTSHDLHLHLEAPDVVRPGEPITISYQSDKPSKIIIFAVDEGILQVTHYTTPSPTGFFFQKQALEVTTQQIVDQIIPKFEAERELSAVGGDEGKPDLNKLLNPFKRKTDLPVVYWSGVVDADTTSKQMTYQVPDYFNGTLRIMAVAASPDAVGDTEKQIFIRGDFIIDPNVPTFVAPGDEFEITASIANNVKGSGKNALIHINITASPSLEVIDSPTSSLNINEREEKTVKIKLRAKSVLGPANITWMANIGDKTSKITSSLSIRPTSTLLTTVTSGLSDKKKVIPLDRVLYPENRSAIALASTNPLILIVGLEQYLGNYPYGCTEQLVSKAFPLLIMADQPWFTTDVKSITDKVQNFISKLIERQMASGGFSYWPSNGDNESNVFASIYAMHFLTEARGHGYTIPSDVYNNGISYLKEIAQGTPSTLDEARNQAYAIYILTRNEMVTTNYLTNLQLYLDKDKSTAWQQDILAIYVASTYQLLKNYPAADKIIKKYRPLAEDKLASDDFYNANVANAQYLYLIARHFPDQLAKNGNQLINSLVTVLNNGEINTVLSSYASLALSSYSQSYGTHTQANTLTIYETLKDGTKKTLSTQDNAYQKASIDDNVKEVIFDNSSQSPYFYQFSQTGFDKNPAKSIKNGMEIYREYRDEKGNIVNSAELGKEVEVHIQVRALNNRYLSNIAITDLLPGGFEVVPDSIAARNIEYSDIREDRIIFFSSIGPDSREMVYHIKATNRGQYVIPPITAISMYNPGIQAISEAGNMLQVE